MSVEDDARKELDDILKGLMTEKRNKLTDKNIIANYTMAQNPNWQAGHKIATEKYKKKLENDSKFKQQISEQARKAAKQIWADPASRKLMTEKFQERSKKDSWKENIKKSAEKRAKDPNWIKANKEAIKERSNSEWKNNIVQRNKDMAKDPDWIKAHQNSRNRTCTKPVLTPMGPFMSLKEAGKAYNLTPEAIGYKVKNKREGYKFITQEEYIKLTGKDPFNEL